MESRDQFWTQEFKLLVSSTWVDVQVWYLGQIWEFKRYILLFSIKSSKVRVLEEVVKGGTVDRDEKKARTEPWGRPVFRGAGRRRNWLRVLRSSGACKVGRETRGLGVLGAKRGI